MSSTRRSTRAKLSTALTSCLGLAIIIYVMTTGLTTIAATIAPNMWGYLGAAGYLIFISPLPALLFSTRWFTRTGMRIMLIGATTITVATLAGQHRPTWVTATWLATVALAYLAGRLITSIPTRLTHRRAQQLLRRHRATPNETAWTLRDWEWAYTHIGTTRALNQAARYRTLRTNTPPE